MPRQPLVAVILAGGDAGDRVAAAAGVTAKALAPLRGRPLTAYPLAALKESGAVDRVVYVGNGDPQLTGLYDAQVPSGERLVDSMALGFGAALALAPNAKLLLLTADIPWLTGEMVARFVAAATAPGTPAAAAHLVYPVITEQAAKAQFPTQQRTFARLREGRFTGGNLALVDAASAPKLLPLMDRAYRARKNPLALASLVGVDVLLALLSGRADLALLERRVGALFGAPVSALISGDAALAADIDTAAQLAAASR